MPGWNGMGPAGRGPLAGWGMGRCAGTGASYGAGPGFGWRGGWGRGGPGWGRRNRDSATGLSGWQRARVAWWGPGMVAPSPQEEMAALRREVSEAEEELAALKARIRELEQTPPEPDPPAAKGTR